LDINLVTALIGIIAGALGYWFSTFSVQPILRFREIRARVHSEFIFYAQVINADNLNDEMKVLHRERIRSNRKSSAELSAAYIELPRWYRSYLELRGLRPQETVRHLIGYSNTYDYDEAHCLEDKIKKALDLPREI
jgi:hypothetical protein